MVEVGEDSCERIRVMEVGWSCLEEAVVVATSERQGWFHWRVNRGLLVREFCAADD